jgi:hypothetical protein
MPPRLLLAALALLPAGALAGDLVGVARFVGAPPAAAAIPTTRDQEACGPAVPDESLVVSGGGVENVIVRVEVPGAKAPPRTVTLDQQGCRYVPRAQVAPLGGTLVLLNGDPVLHNVHGWIGPATAFNVPMPLQGGRTPRPLTRPGLVRVGCDVHAWMSATVLVTETPYAAVSGPGGQFTITGIPAGTWQVVAWHERLGERRMVVTVPAEGSASLELTYP